MTADDQIRLAAAVAVAEAGGETDPRAIPAVCEVMRNRIGKRWPDLQAVVLARLQFSCVNGVTDLGAFVARYAGHPRYPKALEALTGAATDWTHGATHYCRVDCFPSWADGVEPLAVIGHHRFFRVP
jgi:hypothetical protein